MHALVALSESTARRALEDRLLQRGWQVTSAGDKAELGLALDRGRFDLVLVGPELADDELLAAVANAVSTSDANALAQRIAALEFEQQLLAGELHDELAQLLSAAVMHLESAGPSTKEDAELTAAASNLHAALAEVRRLISGLRPPLLEEAGLSGAIAWLVEEARRDIPHTELIDGLAGARLPAAVELAAFRIAQEALANARRHSGAQRVEVQLARKANRIELVVRDWGTGFDASASRPGRFGLEGIRQRAALINGQATIDSTLGEGTTVRALLPLASGGS